MDWIHVIWDDTPGGNVEHVEEHDLTTVEVDYVLENYQSEGFSRSSGSSLCLRLHSRWPLHHRHLRRGKRRHGEPGDSL